VRELTRAWATNSVVRAPTLLVRNRVQGGITHFRITRVITEAFARELNTSRMFNNLTSLSHIYFDDFKLCSYAMHVRICEPRGDGISSFQHLLDNVVLRVSVWIVALVACVGNLFVLIGRMMMHEMNEVHSFFIKNLALADLLMSLYLFIIAYHDNLFRGEYIRHEERWRGSWQCNLCGLLSTISSEASVFTLTIITIDRYLSVLYPFSLKRRTKTFAMLSMSAVWIISILLAVIPLLDFEIFGDEFYGSNGVCLALQIHDPYSKGWEYSLFLFCGINSVAFAFITYAYISMSSTITSSAVGLRTTQQKQDRNIAKRCGFIVATDCLCWMPIVLIKILALVGVPINDSLYAVIAIFLLPVNSALNPVLYTLTTKLFKQHFSKIMTYSIDLHRNGSTERADQHSDRPRSGDRQSGQYDSEGPQIRVNANQEIEFFGLQTKRDFSLKSKTRPLSEHLAYNICEYRMKTLNNTYRSEKPMAIKHIKETNVDKNRKIAVNMTPKGHKFALTPIKRLSSSDSRQSETFL
ncbi:unnamed protein product, partial [Medioppia subpectinata]